MPDRSCSRGHHDKPVNGVCPRCLEIAMMEHDPVLAEVHLQAEATGKGSDYFPDVSEQG